MAEDISHRVGDDEAGRRFDQILAAAAGVSRTEAKRLITEGHAALDGAPAAPSQRAAAGSRVTATVEEDVPSLPPGDVPFAVAFEDPAFVVVDKPAGVVVHPGAGHASGTLVNGLAARYEELAGLGPGRNWGLVHRLDRGTSGLLLVARTEEAHATLQAALRRREVARRYLAVAAGRPFDSATGTIEAPIARDPRRPTRMAVAVDGRPSRTHYRRLAAWPGRTLLEVTLDTGRTHQIRVHMAAIGSALVGDTVYGGRGVPRHGLARVWLHAHALAFPHPTGGETIEVRSPLPAELAAVLEALGEPELGEVPGELA
jgi:23S rRNA pseudouridine1911/1915/1917 synthase